MKAFKMYWLKETKNTQVYYNEEDHAAVSNLYIRKDAFKGVEVPNIITVTIEPVGE